MSPAAPKPRPYRDWLVHLLTWDALLPILVLATAEGLWQMAPPVEPAARKMQVVEVVALGLGVVGFTLRFVWGARRLAAQDAIWQWVPFVLGLMVLALAETAFLLIRGNTAVPGDAWATTRPLFYAYFALMAVAFTPTPNVQPDGSVEW